MGYLNNSVITVDAILTTKGRELLAANDGSFRITQFALSDDEIDYTLYQPNHPSGSAFYGQAIDGMPLLEAFPEESQIMKYKLATLPRGTAKLPILNLGYDAITLQQGATIAITPQTLNYLGNDQVFETAGYSATIADIRLLNTFEGTGINTTAAASANASATTTIGTNVSSTIVGTQFTLRATTVNTLFGANSTLLSTLTVNGLDSGARITIPITITKSTT
ncbi:hypothetical protein N9L94_05200 [Robiginitalea sp.]|nr:hypothetical protein [Robiginitalea sp.]|tara:strand:+ start:8316 stop:8981 length:666 start_codon:yes stop_codon:yes gene_type:complete